MEFMDPSPTPLLSPEDSEALIAEMQKSPTLIHDVSYFLFFTQYERVFSGAELVQWLLSVKGKVFAAKDVENAIAIGQSLLDSRLAHHVTDEFEFKNDSNLFYKLYVDETAEIQVEALRFNERVATATLAGYLKNRTLHYFSAPTFEHCYAILKTTKKDEEKGTTPGKLYIYKVRSASAPFLTLQVQDCACSMTECYNCLADWYCFTITTNLVDAAGSKNFTFCAKNSKQMEAWMYAMQAGGMEFKKVDEGFVDAKSLFELSGNDLMTNEEIPLSKFKGKVCLVVNVSSKCGLTPKNYPELVELHKRYASRGLVILGFPTNQFANQEFATAAEIRKFVDGYGVEFPMFTMIKVNGDDAHPVFKYLKQSLGGVLGSSIKWNFTKFLCDREGKPVRRYSPVTQPFSFEADIVELLGPEQALTVE